MSQIFIISLSIPCIYYLGGTLFPTFIDKLSKVQERDEIELKKSAERTFKTNVGEVLNEMVSDICYIMRLLKKNWWN